jgi:hypothetical protein
MRGTLPRLPGVREWLILAEASANTDTEDQQRISAFSKLNNRLKNLTEKLDGLKVRVLRHIIPTDILIKFL